MIGVSKGEPCVGVPSEAQCMVRCSYIVYINRCIAAIGYYNDDDQSNYACYDDDDDRLTIQQKLFDRLVFSKLRDRLGGNLQYMVAGGAATSLPVLEFFEDIGVPIMEGYDSDDDVMMMMMMMIMIR